MVKRAIATFRFNVRSGPRSEGLTDSAVADAAELCALTGGRAPSDSVMSVTAKAHLFMNMVCTVQ